jgi:hypothetical protein
MADEFAASVVVPAQREENGSGQLAMSFSTHQNPVLLRLLAIH